MLCSRQIAFHEKFDGDIAHEETGEHLIRQRGFGAEHVIEHESDDDSEFEDLLIEPVEQREQPIRLMEDAERIVRPYNLRRNRREPERYGIPVYNY